MYCHQALLCCWPQECSACITGFGSLVCPSVPRKDGQSQCSQAFFCLWPLRALFGSAGIPPGVIVLSNTKLVAAGNLPDSPYAPPVYQLWLDFSGLGITTHVAVSVRERQRRSRPRSSSARPTPLLTPTLPYTAHQGQSQRTPGIDGTPALPTYLDLILLKAYLILRKAHF